MSLCVKKVAKVWHGLRGRSQNLSLPLPLIRRNLLYGLKAFECALPLTKCFSLDIFFTQIPLAFPSTLPSNVTPQRALTDIAN